MENQEKVAAPVATDKTCSISTPKCAKRCATEPLRSLDNTSTPYPSVKKRLVLECNKTPLVSPILNSTSRASTFSTPGQRNASTRGISITRGIQTIAPETVNRYCQVSVARIRKPTATVDVQTEECLLGSSPPAPPPVILIEAESQTDEPVFKNTTVGTTQTEPLPLVQCAAVSCQTGVVEETTEPQNDENAAQQHHQQEQQKDPGSELEAEDQSTLPESITAILHDIAKQYGIEFPSPAKEKKKKSANSKKKEIEYLQECLANKTYKAIASKLDKKMANILEKHMTVYGRETIASRERLMRWTKQFIRRNQQQQNREATGKPLRKTLLVRKIVPAPKRPSVEEKAVQCIQQLAGITVGTQWQRQKPTVTKKKPAPNRKQVTRIKANPKLTSTDSKTCSAGTGTRRSMRQTKLSSYANERDDGKNIQGRQQRKQQGEHSPKPSISAAVTANPKTSASSKTTKAAQPPQMKKKNPNDKKHTQPPTEEIHIEETPSPEPREQELERKYLPYRSPPRYPTQCSKSTETSFLTPSRMRNLVPELMETNRQTLNHHNATEHTRTCNPSVLLSPLERMYVEPPPTPMESRNRPAYNTFLVPLRSNESVPPTPSSRMMYLNPTERRVLLRSGPSNGGLVREKPPEVSIISSQQLYSQIGLAVEKALKNKSLPTLATMYGEPYIEVFNGCEDHTEQRKAAGDRLAEETPKGNTLCKQPHATITDKFVCSSGKEDANMQGSQQRFMRPPFHTERSPSLSPIIYQDENSDDEIIL